MMHKMLHPRNDINRIYVSRKGGRGLISIEDCIDSSIQKFEDYIKTDKERLITAASKSIDNKRSDRKTTRTEMGRKKNVWRFQVTNWQNCK